MEWTTIKPRHAAIILFLFLGTKSVWCKNDSDETKQPECSTLGGRCIDKARNCKGLLLHGYSFKSRVNCMCCVDFKDDEKIERRSGKESKVKNSKTKQKSSDISRPRQESKKCGPNKARPRCAKQGGKCRKTCKSNQQEVTNGCKGGCKCCKPTRAPDNCEQIDRCTSRGGKCQLNSCGDSGKQLKVKCKDGSNCVCCKPLACAKDDSCTANGGSCIPEDECKGRILEKKCKGADCKCCLKRGKCATLDEFECASNDPTKQAKCTDIGWQCDKDFTDCKDGSDEQGCTFAENLSCHWCKTWGSSVTGAPVDPDCKNANYDGNTETMAETDPFVGCATKVYDNGDVWRGFESWQQSKNRTIDCEKGRDFPKDPESAFTRCWCDTPNCNTQLCEDC